MAEIGGFGRSDFASLENVSRETLARVDSIVQELDDWRRKINLIGPAEFDQIWSRHVLDSWQLRSLIGERDRIVDLGSGSGFPALVLAAGFDSESSHITLIESVGKKCAFLRSAITAADLSASVVQGRVEAVSGVQADCVTARAFAPLPRILEYSEKWFADGAYGVFPKGRKWQEELTDAMECWRFAYEAIPSKTGDGAILKISEVSRVES